MTNAITYVFLLGFTFFKLTQSEYTVQVDGGQRACYSEYLKRPKGEERATVEYQVLDGGDLLVDASLHTPSGNLIFADYRKSENTHRFDVVEEGEYQLCLDNGVSSYYERIIFFSIGDDDDEVDEIFKKIDNPDYDGKVNDFKYRFERIHQSIEQIGRLQTTLRSVESRDRHIAERNYEKVNFWSMVNLAVMVIVLIVQVFLIQSLFDEKSLLNRQLNKISAFNSN